MVAQASPRQTPSPYSLAYAVGSREHPLGVNQHAAALQLVVMVQGHLPGVGILLTLPASYNPGLDGGCGGCSACGEGTESRLQDPERELCMARRGRG